MLVVAGTIEGFVSPSDFPIPLKFLLAGVLFIALITYLNVARHSLQPLAAAASD